jgi:hypothetical protein
MLRLRENSNKSRRKEKKHGKKNWNIRQACGPPLGKEAADQVVAEAAAAKKEAAKPKKPLRLPQAHRREL